MQFFKQIRYISSYTLRTNNQNVFLCQVRSKHVISRLVKISSNPLTDMIFVLYFFSENQWINSSHLLKYLQMKRETILMQPKQLDLLKMKIWNLIIYHQATKLLIFQNTKEFKGLIKEIQYWSKWKNSYQVWKTFIEKKYIF